ncbi:LolA-like outer membrane lipoprotein chaperone [Nitratifractor sp.]
MKRGLWILIWMLVSILSAEGIRVPVGFSANFLQKVTNPKKKVIIYRGSVMMKAPATLKWSYREPTRKEVCSDGKRVMVVDHDLEQVSFYRMDKRFDLAAVLRKARHHRDNLYVAKYGGRNYTIALDRQGRISQIAYRDDMDNVVNIHFSHLRYLKKAPPASKLQCKIPASYDRIGE